MAVAVKGFVLGGTKSGVGKTVATLAVIRALSDAGHTVQPAKAGPDFIDPSHHEQLVDRPSRTLDCWLEGEEGLRRNYYRGEGDVCVIEGVMGLYDGDASSTAMVAETLGLPVVLVVDASAGMESVAATAYGFRQYAARADRDIDVAGVLVQRAHGGRHARGIREALPEELAYLGRIPPREELTVPDRHLGLQMGEEAPLSESALSTAAEHLRVERLLAIAGEAIRPATAAQESRTGSGTPADGDSDTVSSSMDGQPTVAVARDEAFRFVYPATIERLRATAEVVTFAPTAGDDLPDCDGVYLPGGYPELHADALAASPALATLADRATDDLAIFGECGGLMALCESLTTTDDERHEMAGILPADVQMHDRYQALNHVELRAGSDTLTADAGGQLRGHEFHYSSATPRDDARFAFEMVRGDGISDGQEGLTEYRTLGTYSHVHAESGAFDTFLDRCRVRAGR